MQHIGVILANHERLDVLRIFFESINRLREETSQDIPCITSGGVEAIPLCREYGIEHYDYPNKPLTGKFNNSMVHMCQKHDVDCVMLMGSDDLISTKTYLAIQQEMESHDMVGLSDLYMFDLDGATKDSLFYFQHTTVLGPGRTIRKDIIQRLNHPVWNIDRDRAIDVIMLDSVRHLVKTSKSIKGHLFDLKSVENMNPISFWSQRLAKVSNDILYGNIGTKESELIKQIINK